MPGTILSYLYISFYLICVKSLKSVNFLDPVFLHLGTYTIVIINDPCKELCTKMFAAAFFI